MKTQDVSIQRMRFGTQATDRITGVAGTVTGFCDYITGCRQYQLEWEKDGQPHSRWFDESRLSWGDVIYVDLEPTERLQASAFEPNAPGGPVSNPPSFVRR